jgi:hypothetical protein
VNVSVCAAPAGTAPATKNNASTQARRRKS